MRSLIIAAALAAAATITPAEASVYSDDLGKCLVAKTSDADKAQLVKWVFAAVSANPAVRELTPMTDPDRDAVTKSAAIMIQRLITVDCRADAVAAMKYDGPESIQGSFSILGEVAMRGLMSDGAVVAILNRLDTYSDKAAWAALAKEAGIQPPPAPAK